MMNYAKLANEITTDPLNRGYSAMTDQDVADSLNAVDRNNWVAITSAQLFEAIDPTEFQALTADQQARVDRLLGLGSGIETAPGSQARDEIIAIFGGASTTVANLIPIANQQRSRAQELALLGRSPEVGLAHVARARAL